MNLSKSLALSIIIAALPLSEQMGLRHLAYNEAEPDCDSFENGFQTCKNEKHYYECSNGWPLTRPVAPGTKCCTNYENNGRVFPVHDSVTDCNPSSSVDNETDFSKDFQYPDDMPPPPEMWVEGFASRLQARNIQKYETPIQVWQVWRLDQTMWNCIAHYHPTALNAITKSDPVPRVAQKYHTSEARALCMIHAVNKLIPDLEPLSKDIISGWLDDLGLDSSIMTDADATKLASDGNPSPRVIGSLVAAEVISDMQIDGWNYKGTKTADGEDCTANCRPFTDTYGYAPKNNPWKVSNSTAWQPLIESNDIGFFFAQEHVTPHIGFHAKPVVLTREELNERKLSPPDYDYEIEVQAAIEHTVDLASDPYKTEMVKFLDNKINLAGGLMKRLRAAYNLSLEAQVFYHYGYASAEHDVVLLSWKEKIRHDRIRPTSLVQALGDTEIQSFAGTHKAKDWVPLIRVMPHSEYPSGSGCICIAAAQYIDEFLLDQYGHDSMSTTWEFEDIGPVTFDSLTEVAHTCGESRLWGGMHFSKSVPDSYTLCDGVGKRGYTDLMKPLLGRGDYSELMDGTKMKYN